MKTEENVCERIAQAESVASATARVRELKDGGAGNSAALGKFKSVDALQKAYTALQAEFTRRSQRLKELERRTENFSEQNKGAADLDVTRSGAEKLRENANVRKVEEKAFQNFVADLEKGKSPTHVCDECNMSAEEPTKKEAEKQERISGGVAETDVLNKMGDETGNQTQTKAQTEALSQAERAEKEAEDTKEKGAVLPLQAGAETSVAKSRGAFEESEDLYTRVSRDEGVRLRIIGEYLSSLKKSGAPLMTTGSGAFVAPPLKAKTIQEAGGLALRFFQQGKSE